MEGEPCAKKSRITEEIPSEEKEVDKRSITLNLAEYPDWVRSLSDEELEKIFSLGVSVRVCLQMKVESNQKHLEKVLEYQLDSQMKPVKEKVAGIKNEVSKEVQEIERQVTQSVSDNISAMTNTMNDFKQEFKSELTQIKIDLVTNVSGVADKVKPLESLNTKIDETKEKLLEEVKKLNQSVQDLGKPKTKGLIGELSVLNILKAELPKNFTVQHSATFGQSGDVLVTTPEKEEFPIEVKNHESTIAKQEIEKFEKVVADSTRFKVGIMLSLKSGIAKRAKRGNFEINQDKNKYFIYVPNALQQENLIVWSVMLANELAQINAELKESQNQKLKDLYKDFEKSIDSAKKSRINLESLEEVVKNLKENIEPILKIVEQSKNDIYKLLHQS